MPSQARYLEPVSHRCSTIPCCKHWPGLWPTRSTSKRCMAWHGLALWPCLLSHHISQHFFSRNILSPERSIFTLCKANQRSIVHRTTSPVGAGMVLCYGISHAHRSHALFLAFTLRSTGCSSKPKIARHSHVHGICMCMQNSAPASETPADTPKASCQRLVHLRILWQSEQHAIVLLILLDLANHMDL